MSTDLPVPTPDLGGALAKYFRVTMTDGVQQKVRRAAKTHSCEGYRCPRKPTRIKPGEHYLLCTEFPGGELGYADHAGHPIRFKYCADCAKDTIYFLQLSENPTSSTEQKETP